MKQSIMGAIVAVTSLAGAAAANAATFAGYTAEPTTEYFNGGATLLYQAGIGGQLFDDTTSLPLVVDGGFAADFSSPFLTILDTASLTDVFSSGSVLDYALEFNASGDDMVSVLWDLTGGTGSTDYGIMTFTGEFGFDNVSDALAGTVFSNGVLKVIGASKDSVNVIPLPAGLPLMLAGLGGLVAISRRRS